MDTKCSAINRDGRPCSGVARLDRPYCWAHDPELNERRAEGQRKGGAARSNKVRARRQYASGGLTPAEVAGLLGKALTDVLSGTLEPGPANAAAGIARALLAVREATELETRISELEQRAGISPKERTG